MTNLQSYSELHEFDAVLDGQPVHVVSKPGFAHWNEVTPAAHLLAEAAHEFAKSSTTQLEVLAMGCGHAALGSILAKQPGVNEVYLADTTVTALEMAGRTLQANQVMHAHLLTDPLALVSKFDFAFIELPKGRSLSRRWLLEAQTALKPSGSLFLAGANDEGIQPAIRDGQALFGNAKILGYKKGNRVARLINDTGSTTTPEWAAEAGIRPGTWMEFDVQRKGVLLHLRSLPGVFSTGELDEGTALLLDHLSLPTSARVLDAGCGYGVIGLLAWRLGARSVDMVDNNFLAIACARQNISRNIYSSLQEGEPTIRAFPVDALEFKPDQGYTHVLSNPPFHAGKAVDTHAAQAFVEQSLRLLVPGGQVILVANRFLRYDRLMQDQFGNVSRLAETGKYHLLLSVKRGKE